LENINGYDEARYLCMFLSFNMCQLSSLRTDSFQPWLSSPSAEFLFQDFFQVTKTWSELFIFPVAGHDLGVSKKGQPIFQTIGFRGIIIFPKRDKRV